MALTDRAIKNAKARDKAWKLSNSGSLYVLVQPNGSKLWRWKYRVSGKGTTHLSSIEAVIPGRSNRRVKIEHNRTLYRQRNRIERMFGHLKINRAITTRYDQLANSFLGMVHIATARYWLKFVHAA